MSPNELIRAEFVGKYLIPTDNFRQQSENIIKEYTHRMKNNEKIAPISVTTLDKSADKSALPILVSDIEKLSEPVFIVDGHHRYIAHLNQKNYPLMAIWIEYSPDNRMIRDYYDFLEAYEYVQDKTL